MIGKINALIALHSAVTNQSKLIYIAVDEIAAILYDFEKAKIILRNGEDYYVEESVEQVIEKMEHFGVEFLRE